MPLPPDILHAVSNPHGGRLVLVIGAGTSVEPPTRLKLATEYAQEAHRRLLADNILEEPCDDPNDLSLVADYVYHMVFDGDRIKHMTKIWNDTISLQQLGWA